MCFHFFLNDSELFPHAPAYSHVFPRIPRCRHLFPLFPICSTCLHLFSLFPRSSRLFAVFSDVPTYSHVFELFPCAFTCSQCSAFLPTVFPRASVIIFSMYPISNHVHTVPTFSYVFSGAATLFQPFPNSSQSLPLNPIFSRCSLGFEPVPTFFLFSPRVPKCCHLFPFFTISS